MLDEVAREFPEYINVKSGLGKIRSKNLPTLPKSIDEIKLTGNLNLIFTKYLTLLFVIFRRRRENKFWIELFII